MRVLIVDDEKLARDRMRRLLQKHDDVEILGEATDGIQALNEIERLSPDVVFLDIEMPELDGLSVAQTLQNRNISLVFVTAYDEHALRAFEVSAVDYLVKPVPPLRLESTLRRIRSRKPGTPLNYSDLIAPLEKRRALGFPVKVGSKFILVDRQLISAVLAQDHYANLIIGDREYLVDDSIENLMIRLAPLELVRVHRSAALNPLFLKEIERDGDRRFTAVLKDAKSTRVAIARDRLSLLKKHLQISAGPRLQSI